MEAPLPVLGSYNSVLYPPPYGVLKIVTSSTITREMVIIEYPKVLYLFLLETDIELDSNAIMLLMVFIA